MCRLRGKQRRMRRSVCLQQHWRHHHMHLSKWIHGRRIHLHRWVIAKLIAWRWFHGRESHRLSVIHGAKQHGFLQQQVFGSTNVEIIEQRIRQCIIFLTASTLYYSFRPAAYCTVSLLGLKLLVHLCFLICLSVPVLLCFLGQLSHLPCSSWR